MELGTRIGAGIGNRARVARTLGVVFASFVGLLSVGAAAASAASPIIQIAPTSTFTNPVPVGLADNGTVVGNDGTSGAPFTWTSTLGFTALKSPTAGGFFTYSSSVAGVSPTGEVVGHTSPNGYDFGAAVVWMPGSSTPTLLDCLIGVGAPGPCGSFDDAYATAANATGEIVGTGTDRNVTACTGYFNGCDVPSIWTDSGAVPTEVGNVPGGGIAINAAGSVLWSGSDGIIHVTTAKGQDTAISCLASAAGLNASTTVIGVSTGSPRMPASWSAGTCTNLPLLPGTAASAGGAAEAINTAGTIVGRSGAASSSTAVEWKAGKVINLNSLLPAGSGWVLSDAFAINTAGQIVGSGTLNGKAAYFLLGTVGYTVSGTVLGDSCTDNGCSNTPIDGGGILVTGKAADGSAVSASTETAADGTWSVQVPNGTYTVGPTLDQATIADFPSFDPGSYAITVNGADVPSQDFSSCLVSDDAVSSQDGQSDLARSPQRRGGPLATASAAKQPACVSKYTITLKASIPQHEIVDPSLDAHYKLTPTKANGGGYNTNDYWFTHWLRSGKITRLLASLPQFPACSQFPPSRIATLTRENAKIRYYSAIEGGQSLGSATVTLAWNQSAGQMEFVSGPTYKTVELTRTFEYDLQEPGKPAQFGHCNVIEPVNVMLAPVLSSADGAGGVLTAKDFTLVASWNFPFEPAGVSVDDDVTLTQAALNVGKEMDDFLGTHKNLRTIYQTGKLIVSFVAIAKTLHALKAASLLRAASFFDGEVPAALVKTVGGGISLLHGLAYAHDVYEVWEIVGGVLGYGEDDAYPLMSTVVRGHFETSVNQYGTTNTGHANVPTRTTLAVSAQSTQFPNISMTISRAPAPNPNPGIETYSGVLPWHTTSGLRNAANLYVTNSGSEGFGANPTGLINHSEEAYAAGKSAVKDLIEAMSNMKVILETLQETKQLVDPSTFGRVNRLAPDPACTLTPKNPQPTAGTTHTICWQFADGVS